MKVSELIEKLRQCRQDAEVYIEAPYHSSPSGFCKPIEKIDDESEPGLCILGVPS